jgi:hypothetical protein
MRHADGWTQEIVGTDVIATGRRTGLTLDSAAASTLLVVP